ncbi:MAG: 3-oxoacyl-[acyl-carrier-protein] reductase [Ignavibacteriales bacterium]|nr:3-oxoacyl-[acyl-carrier-protein] reductase [Ignavibacteriales bacterium]
MGWLTGRTALVTGASRGIGKAITLMLAEEGADIAFTYKSASSAADEVVEAIRAKGVRAVAHQADAKDPASAERVVNDVIRELGRIDILVNNAGITRDRLLVRMSEEDWDEVIDTNLKSAFIYCRAVVRHMVSQRRGKIVNVASIAGVVGNPGQTNYAAAKSGMIGLTKTVAKEYASRNIQVNAVAPGFVATEMVEKLDASHMSELAGLHPIKLIAQPEEIAELVLFFASPASDYITGQVLPGIYD